MSKTPYEIIKDAYLVEYDQEDGSKFYKDLQPHRSKTFSVPEFQPDIPEWPLTPQHLREVERQVLQNPEWLHYWAYFDWRSWMEPAEWHYDRHRDQFVFFNVPQLRYMHDRNLPEGQACGPDRTLLYIKPNGQVIESDSQYAQYYVTLPSAVQVCLNKVRQAGPKLKFLKGTYYIRFGMWPKNERSQNFLAGKDAQYFEKGVSAYHCSYDLDDDRWAIDPSVDYATVAGTMQSLIYGNRPVFLVQGTEIKEEGSDGEPLLHNVKLIKQLDKNDVYVPGIFDPKEDLE